MLELATALAVMHRQHPTAIRQLSLYTWICLAMPVVVPPAKLQYVGCRDAKGARFSDAWRNSCLQIADCGKKAVTTIYRPA